MSDVDKLWARIEDARTRLGQLDQAEVRQAEDLGKRLKEIRAGLAQRHAEVERRRLESDRLRHENEQLRRMLHRLLLSIEERYSGRLKTALQEIAEQVSGLMAMGETEETPGADEAGQPEPPRAETDAAVELPAPAAPAAVAAAVEADVDTAAGEPEAPGEPSALPDEDDSAWLKQIMERARELTAEAERGRVIQAVDESSAATAALSRSAVA